MSDDEYSEEDYEYEYTDDEDGPGVEGDSMDASQEELVNDHITGARAKPAKDNMANKRRSIGSMDESRRSGDSANAPPLSGGKFDFEDGCAIRMLPADELKPIMNNHVQEVVEVLGAPPSAAAILMREHKWAKERLFQSFFDNPEKVQGKCGVLARCQTSRTDGEEKTANTAANRPSAKRKHCEICLDEDGYDPREMIRMPCGHEFCESCWFGYVNNALDKGPLCVRETCPQAGCNELMTEEEVSRAAPDLLPKFEIYQLRSFVETYGMTRWCPGPGCEQVALAPGAGGVFADAGGVAKCNKCETCFCLKCGEEPHAPVTCKDLAMWQEKCRNESETANWILANTKPCPKCSSRIEKNQGCNHMTCSSCKYEFCWICMGNWTEHGANTGGYYKCNKFDPSSDGEDQSDAAKAKRELDRYLHYYKRFHGHSQAQDFAKKSVKETEARMVLLQEQNSETVWTDVEFLKTANEQLVDCRKVLKYTYAYAYYLEDCDKRSRFEYHQEMLERFTENLSELSEKPLQEMNRTEVVNQTRVVDRFMKNVLKYVEEGMED